MCAIVHLCLFLHAIPSSFASNGVKHTDKMTTIPFSGSHLSSKQIFPLLIFSSLDTHGERVAGDAEVRLRGFPCLRSAVAASRADGVGEHEVEEQHLRGRERPAMDADAPGPPRRGGWRRPRPSFCPCRERPRVRPGAGAGRAACGAAAGSRGRRGARRCWGVGGSGAGRDPAGMRAGSARRHISGVLASWYLFGF